MSRSVYSVVLDDEVVAAVDLAAMRAGTNRSAMINRLLAAQLQHATPEDRIRSVFAAMQQMTANRYTTLQVIEGESQFAVRSALRYKYNPTVRYSIELFAHSSEYLGVLRCQLRTQNVVLVQLMQSFYSLWTALEQSTQHTSPQLYQMEGARFSRVLQLPRNACTEEQMADRLTRYVALLDSCMKLYCEYAALPENAAAQVMHRYRSHMDDGLEQL